MEPTAFTVWAYAALSFLIIRPHVLRELYKLPRFDGQPKKQCECCCRCNKTLRRAKPEPYNNHPISKRKKRKKGGAQWARR